MNFLKDNLNPDNAFMLLTQARLFDEPQLATLCLNCIDQNTAEALNADGRWSRDLAAASASVRERLFTKNKWVKLKQKCLRGSRFVYEFLFYV